MVDSAGSCSLMPEGPGTRGEWELEAGGAGGKDNRGNGAPLERFYHESET